MLKTCASIQSFCCYTKVGLAVAFPVLEAMGIECAPVQSCLLSTEVHGYGDFYITSSTDLMKATFDNWDRENLKWDSIYSGFLGDVKQVDLITDFVKKHSESFVVIDPVLGDNGKTYGPLQDAQIPGMKRLVSVADVITPNQTEAAFLLDLPQQESYTVAEAYSMAKALLALGPKTVFITSINLSDADSSKCHIVYADKNECSLVSHNKYDKLYYGTGDLYASVLLGSLLHNVPIKEAATIAGETVYLALKKTDEAGYTNIGHGVQSVTVLPYLSDKFKKYFN